MTSLNAYASNPNPEAMQEVQERLSAAFSKIDKAVKRGVIHPNNGARKKARLTTALKRQQGQGISPTVAEPPVVDVDPNTISDEVSAQVATQ